MPVYDYEELKRAAKDARVEATLKGFRVTKRLRRKPQDKEKAELIYEMALI
jgi:hypothetical protein